jgi:hypothetical protein
MAMSTSHQSTPVAQAPGEVSIEALQAQVGSLSQELAGLRAERDVLVRRVRGMPASQLRVQLEAQGLELTGRVTQTEMSLASARAQIATRMGVSENMIGAAGTISIPPPFNPRRGADPNMVIGLAFVTLMCIVLPMSIAHARRIWRGKAKESATPRADESPGRLERLEQALDAVAIEIERVAEGQRFVTKILAERPAAAAPGPAVAMASATANGMADPGLGEPKPFLALGAGPIEPIRVAERQAVRQSITPH